MADYEEAGYYEVQLNNKQLVFFFMAAVAIAVVIFLCGVMVGRGVRDTAVAAGGGVPLSAAGAIFPEEASPTPAEVRRELDFPQRLERAEVEDRLEKSAGPERAGKEADSLASAKRLVSEPLAKTAMTKTAMTKTATSQPTTTNTKGAPTPSASSKPGASAPSEPGAYVVQVVALKTRGAADTLVARLKGKGYRAYLESGDGSGLFRVRVGRFTQRAEAVHVAQQLRDVEKFKPYITQ